MKKIFILLFIVFTVVSVLSLFVVKYLPILTQVFTLPGLYIAGYPASLLGILFPGPNNNSYNFAPTLLAVFLTPLINGLIWSTVICTGYYLYKKLVKKSKSRKKKNS